MGVVPVELDRDESGALVFGRMTQPVPTIERVPENRRRSSPRSASSESVLPVERVRQRRPDTRTSRSTPPTPWPALRPDLAALAALDVKA